MWMPVKKENEERGLIASTVGELKEILNLVPDNYTISVTGAPFGIVMEPDAEQILMDDIPFLENLLIEQEERN